MHTKHYLTTILIFSAVFLSGFSVKSQSASDTIRAEKRGLRYIYYQGNVMLDLSQVMQITRSNPEALKLMENSTGMRNAGYIFAGLGGGCIGYALGYGLARAVSDRTIHQGLFFGMLGTGAAVIGIAIAFESGANKKVKEGVDVFNNAVKKSKNTSIDLGFSPGGVMFRLGF